MQQNVVHQIITNGQPVFSRARRLETEKLNAAKKECELMMQAGICQPSKSPWASPLHMVRKRNGEWRHMVTTVMSTKLHYTIFAYSRFCSKFGEHKIFHEN